jgi:hypothetical protein
MIRFPDEKFSVICLVNLSSIDPSPLCRKIADIYLADKITEKKTTERARENRREKAPPIIALASEKLDEYVGSYYNDELPATYILLVEKGKLFFKHRNAPRGALRPTGEDIFLSGYGKMNFLRDQDKNITGFYLDAGRVRIQFMKN